MLVGTLVIRIESVPLNRNIVKMIGVVTTPFMNPVGLVFALLRPVSLDVVFHPALFGSGPERLAGNFVFGMLGILRVMERTVVVPLDALDAVGPRAGDTQLEAEDLGNLRFRVGV